jgi:hypothetical protein
MKNTDQKKDLTSGPDTRSIPVTTVDLGKTTEVNSPIVGQVSQGDGKNWKWPWDKDGTAK